GFGRRPSSASGRYQIIADTFNRLSGQLGIGDFYPHTQDLMATRLLEEKGAIEPLMRGDLDTVLPLIAGVWASLPKSRTEGGRNGVSLWIKTDASGAEVEAIELTAVLLPKPPNAKLRERSRAMVFVAFDYLLPEWKERRTWLTHALEAAKHYGSSALIYVGPV